MQIHSLIFPYEVVGVQDKVGKVEKRIGVLENRVMFSLYVRKNKTRYFHLFKTNFHKI